MLMRLLKLVEEKKKDKIDPAQQSYFISDKTTPSLRSKSSSFKAGLLGCSAEPAL